MLKFLIFLGLFVFANAQFDVSFFIYTKAKPVPTKVDESTLAK